ncbi:hypothetical protein EYF80_024936 [Liparis tanakae]|uniref:Uncharacterized protein n=1 Tax=Liparis tanakae TaxID=230148 RepID=A0A4Z2HHV2_9TELE|nr:hypothetical protein EYF80_024936 [Liparis tanakae]
MSQTAFIHLNEARGQMAAHSIYISNLRAEGQMEDEDAVAVSALRDGRRCNCTQALRCRRLWERSLFP